MKNEHRAPWGCTYAKEDQSQCRPGNKPKSDQEYFEILGLCLLQAGLNWGSVRKHWQRYREGFCGFDPRRLSGVPAEQLLEDSRVIRNKRKVEAILFNAQEFQKIKREYGAISNFLKSLEQVPDEELPRSLARRFKHIGVYTATYYLHSVGHSK